MPKLLSHTSASRLSISLASPRKHSHVHDASLDAGRFSPVHPISFSTPVVRSPFRTGIHLSLPRRIRSLKGLAVLFCVVLVTSVWLMTRYRVDPVLAAARREAQLAEQVIQEALPLPIAVPESQTHEPHGILKRWLHAWRHQEATHGAEHVGLKKVDVQKNDLVFPSNGSHLFHPNGLLLVNSASHEHPILSLVRKAEADWTRLQQKQSKTLQQALREYRKRYRRAPPEGFEQWWRYVQDNRVLLPDEYDQIHDDLSPFWGMDPHELKMVAQIMQQRPHTFTLVIKTDGTVDIEGPFAHIRRATDMATLVRRFAANLPRAINMTFIMDDSPAVLVPHEIREKMIDMGKHGEYFGPSDYVNVEIHTTLALDNFAKACSPNSNLRSVQLGSQTPRSDNATTRDRSFLYDPIVGNDICEHPEIKSLHGHTMRRGTDPTPLVPLFAWAKMKTHSDILVTPLEQYWDEYEGHDPQWNFKAHDKLLWRGSTTGSENTVNEAWQKSQRARLHMMTKEHKGERDILVSKMSGQFELETWPTRELNDFYMDTSFSGEPAQCDPETCAFMRNNMSFAPLVGLDESYQYKYVMDVDGNSWSGRFHRLMSTNSLVLKSTVFPEWYAQRLVPWYHYVPVKVDYSDLFDIMAFFVGTPDGRGAHDTLAHRIAQNGKNWAKRYWRRADMASYMYRLLLEYSRLLHQDDVDI